MADMQALSPYMAGYHLLLGLIFSVSFALMGAKGWLSGLKNGILILSPLAAATLIVFATQPIPADILQMWALGDLLQGAIAGAALGLAKRCCGGACGC
jgi:hypothetical protein